MTGVVFFEIIFRVSSFRRRFDKRAQLNLEFQVLSPNDLDEVYAFAESRFAQTAGDENERKFALWTVKWRREALEHYLKIGWSFIARRNGVAAGFFLAQPFMFFRGQTQTVWVEHIEAVDESALEALAEVAVKVTREKHMQRVLFADADADCLEPVLKRWQPAMMNERIAEIRTTKG